MCLKVQLPDFRFLTFFNHRRSKKLQYKTEKHNNTALYRLEQWVKLVLSKKINAGILFSMQCLFSSLQLSQSKSRGVSKRVLSAIEPIKCYWTNTQIEHFCFHSWKCTIPNTSFSKFYDFRECVYISLVILKNK